MTSDNWWRGAALYQVYPLSFADSNGDGWGDLPGITARLEYIAGLGVDGIWLSPFYQSPLADHGYDTTDHKAVDPRCGTLEDFDRLLARAHELGLKVLVDQVYTYTSNRHPWFLESRSARQGARSDWYVWADPKPDGSPPNNWQSIFGGPAWAWDRGRRQYFMTHFLQDMPHLRGEHPGVQEALLDIGRFWLQRGVDGFRMDVINLSVVDPQLRDNPSSGQRQVAMPADAQQLVNDRSQPAGLDFVGRIRRLADEAPGRFLLGEVSGPDPMATAKLYSRGPDRLHSVYFLLADTNRALCAATLRAELSAWNEEDSWPTWSFSNHDTVRAVTRCGRPEWPPGFATLLVALLASARGTMLLYQGDELGLPDGEVPFERLRDPASRRFFPDHLQRDGSRTPMPWDSSSPNAGFSAGRPWLPVGPLHPALSVDRQERDADSTLHWTRRLIDLRRNRPVLRRGSMRFLDLQEPLLGIERADPADRVLCLFNVSASPIAVDLPELEGAVLLAGQSYSSSSGTRANLGAFGFCIAALPPGTSKDARHPVDP